MSKKWCFSYDIGYNNNPLIILCHVVYATLGVIQNRFYKCCHEYVPNCFQFKLVYITLLTENCQK